MNREEFLKLIEELDVANDGKGAQLEKLAEKTELDFPIVRVMHQLNMNGDIYEIGPNRWKVLK